MPAGEGLFLHLAHAWVAPVFDWLEKKKVALPSLNGRIVGKRR